MHDLIPLSALRAGDRGLVELVLGGNEHVHRMQEIGVRSGATVEMVQPGSPCIVLLAGQRLCFRSGELLNVMVRLGVPA